MYIKTAEQSVGIEKDAQWGQIGQGLGNAWQGVKGLFGQPQSVSNNSQTTQQQNLDENASTELLKNLQNSLSNLEKMFNPQIRSFNRAYKTLRPFFGQKIELPQGVANQIKNLINSLNQSANSESSDSKFLDQIALQAQGIANFMTSKTPLPFQSGGNISTQQHAGSPGITLKPQGNWGNFTSTLDQNITQQPSVAPVQPAPASPLSGPRRGAKGRFIKKTPVASAFGKKEITAEMASSSMLF